MSTIEDTNIPNVGAGILMPQQKNRWRLVITPSVPLIDEIKDTGEH